MKKYIVIAAIAVVAIIGLSYTPNTNLKIYKFVHNKYVRIFKRGLKRRFSDEELQIAVNNARQQDWVRQQIAADLTPFKRGISTEQLDKWYNDFDSDENRLVRVKIKDSAINLIKVRDKFKDTTSFKTVHSILNILTANKLIPDCEFIISINDYLSDIPKDYEGPAAILSFAKHLEVPVEKDVILVPDWMNTYYWDVLKNRVNYAARVYPWQQKQNIIHWRGGAADSMLHRVRAIELSNLLPFVDAKITQGKHAAPVMDPEQSIAFKYQLALDGSRCTWERVVWQMQSNSVMIKPESQQVQWFYKGLKPYHNYIPIKDIDKNSINRMYEWLLANDETIEQISHNATEFANNNFKTQDFVAYYAVLLQEYAKLMS